MASYLSYRNVLLSNSTVIASTLNAGSVSYSTLTGSTMSSRALDVSTLTGSTITISTLTGSTINVSTLTGSTIQGTTVFFSTMTASTILTAGSTINLARNVNVPNRFVEVGCDLEDSMYLDFHSKDSALPDYSTRIISQGGATTGTGGLNMYASTIGLVATNGVGIGTTAPNASLHVYGTGGVSLATTGTVDYTNTSILGFGFGGGSFGTRDSFRIISQVVNRDNGAGPTFYDYGAQADLVFVRKTNNLYSDNAADKTYTEAVRIHGASGFMGIGTYLPATPLHVFSSSTGHPSIIRINTTISGFGSSANGGRLEWYGTFTGNGGSYFQAAIQGIDDVSGDSGYGGLAFITVNNTTQLEIMRISSGGNVGIGTTNPGYPLDVVGITRSAGIINTAPGYYIGYTTNTAIVYQNNGTNNANGTLYANSYNYVMYPSNTQSPAGFVTTTGGKYSVSYSGIYAISFTLGPNATQSGTLELFIAKNQYSNDLNTPGTGTLASSTAMVNMGQVNMAWTGYLSSGDFITAGCYMGSGSCTLSLRTTLSITLVHRTA